MRKITILLVFMLIFSCTKYKQNNTSEEINKDNNINDGYLLLDSPEENIILVKSTLSSQELLNQIIFSGNITELDKIITIGQLCNFTNNDLRLLRNTIFAKYGYKFNSIDLQNHFSKFSWYSGTMVNIDNKLTIVDLDNIELIQKIEDNYPEENDLINELIGDWYMFGAVPDQGIDNISLLVNRSDHTKILPNGIYIHYCRLHFQSEEICTNYGLWSLENNILETIIIGNDLIHDFPPNYGKTDFLPNYGKIDFQNHMFEFNDGSTYLGCHLFGNNGGGWVKK